jgi:hypothetical protein
VTIRNVNRDPVISGIEVATVKKDGTTVPEAEKSPGNYSFAFGKVYQLDVTNLITDLDEGLENGDGVENIGELTFEWQSNIDGVIGTEPSINVGAGKGSSLADFKLKAGKKHEITLRVTDTDGGSDEYTFTVKVGDEGKGGPGFEAVFFVASVGVAAAILSYRRRSK